MCIDAEQGFDEGRAGGQVPPAGIELLNLSDHVADVELQTQELPLVHCPLGRSRELSAGTCFSGNLTVDRVFTLIQCLGRATG